MLNRKWSDIERQHISIWNVVDEKVIAEFNPQNSGQLVGTILGMMMVERFIDQEYEEHNHALKMALVKQFPQTSAIF